MSEKSGEHRVRIEVLYSGHVQGVGFRYTARGLARGFLVTGFVKNLPDGGVELVAEGAPDEVRRFLDAIAAEMGHYIHSAAETPGPASGRYQGFAVRF